MQKPDLILLLEAWTGRRFSLDIRDTEAGNQFLDRVTTDRVHQISETERTADVYLDALTVLPNAPAGNTVLVLPGKFQLYEKLIEITDIMESPTVPMIQPKDCDPSVVAPIRWSLLCAREDLFTGEYKLLWSHAKPDGRYPEVPYNCVPLALIKVSLGAVVIEHQDILTWRSVKPGYDPDSKYWLAPVKDEEERDAKYGNGEDVPEGAQLLVLSEGKNYYWENGAWRAQSLMPFDNTVFIRDLTEPLTRIDLPWSITDPVEISVFRDGQYVAHGNDYDFVAYAGPSTYLVFNRILLPGQRIVVIRNPFFGAAYNPGGGGGGGGGNIPINLIDIYVDGEIGNDTWDGSEANPFKTLQRGFDACAAFSNNAYRIHARRLKLVDAVTDPGEHKCWAWVRNLRANTLMIEIEDDCEWSEDNSVIEYAYMLYSTSFVQYVNHPIHYSFMHVETVSAFVDVQFNEGMEIYGGYTTFNTCTYGAAQDRPVSLFASGSGDMHDTELKNFRIGTNAMLRAYSSKFENVSGSAGGALDMIHSEIHQTAHFENAALMMSLSAVSGAAGSFTGGYVLATYVDDINPSTKRATPFFSGGHGCTMEMDHVTIDFIAGDGIYLHHGCSLRIANSSVQNCNFNCILLTHGSHIEATNVDISNGSISGVKMELGSYGKFTDCFGYGSSRYGIECTGFSRGERDNTAIWGFLGDYYELIPGSDTVITDRADMVPGTLDEKIEAGACIYTKVVPTGIMNNNKFEIGIDIEALTMPDADGNAIINMAPTCHVFQRNIPIVEPGTGAVPNPDSYIDYSMKWSGDGFLSSVLRRISDPTEQTKIIYTNLGNAENFVQMDQWRGTEFVADGLTLKNYPQLGYPVEDAYFVIAKPGMYGSIAGLNLSILQGFTMDVDVPDKTKLQVAFSINGGATWLTWDNLDLVWVQLPGESTLIALQKAEDYDVVQGWLPICWERLRQLNGTTIIPGFLLTCLEHSPILPDDPPPYPNTLTPKIRSYSWTYVEDGYWLDISEHFERTFYTERAVFKYKGTLGATIDPPIRFTIYPLRNRG